MNNLALALPIPAFPAMPSLTEETLDKVRQVEAEISELPQMQIDTLHVIHGGMYSRTVMVPANHVIVGVLIKVPTQVIVAGTARVLVGDKFQSISGFNVLPGQAGRKAIFIAISDIYITMIFKTDAQTVDEAEAEFTDETDILASRRDESHNIFVKTED